MIEVEYMRATMGGRMPARGLQVGRFAVRVLGHGKTGRNPDGSIIALLPFTVDHIPSGTIVGHFASRPDALAFADEISICTAAVDPDAEDVPTLQAQFARLDPDVQSWAEHVAATGGKFIPFREWKAARDAKGAA